eukprot:7886413-Pyramimonas_sp.AAC.1
MLTTHHPGMLTTHHPGMLKIRSISALVIRSRVPNIRSSVGIVHRGVGNRAPQWMLRAPQWMLRLHSEC